VRILRGGTPYMTPSNLGKVPTMILRIMESCSEAMQQIQGFAAKSCRANCFRASPNNSLVRASTGC
jgi:hypothetical protein